MKQLKQYDDPKAYTPNHRMPFVFEVPDETYVGPRGGVRIPLDIVWKHVGSGLGAQVFRTCSCTALYPYVRYHNGDEKPRKMPVHKWVKSTGLGSFRMYTDEEHKAFTDEVLRPCDAEKDKYRGRVGDIVKSILDNGGTVSITTR